MSSTRVFPGCRVPKDSQYIEFPGALSEDTIDVHLGVQRNDGGAQRDLPPHVWRLVSKRLEFPSRTRILFLSRRIFDTFVTDEICTWFVRNLRAGKNVAYLDIFLRNFRDVQECLRNVEYLDANVRRDDFLRLLDAIESRSNLSHACVVMNMPPQCNPGDDLVGILGRREPGNLHSLALVLGERPAMPCGGPLGSFVSAQAVRGFANVSVFSLNSESHSYFPFNVPLKDVFPNLRSLEFRACVPSLVNLAGMCGLKCLSIMIYDNTSLELLDHIASTFSHSLENFTVQFCTKSTTEARGGAHADPSPAAARQQLLLDSVSQYFSEVTLPFFVNLANLSLLNYPLSAVWFSALCKKLPVNLKGFYVVPTLSYSLRNVANSVLLLRNIIFTITGVFLESDFLHVCKDVEFRKGDIIKTIHFDANMVPLFKKQIALVRQKNFPVQLLHFLSKRFSVSKKVVWFGTERSYINFD